MDIVLNYKKLFKFLSYILSDFKGYSLSYNDIFYLFLSYHFS